MTDEKRMILHFKRKKYCETQFNLFVAGDVVLVKKFIETKKGTKYHGSFRADVIHKTDKLIVTKNIATSRVETFSYPNFLMGEVEMEKVGDEL